MKALIALILITFTLQAKALDDCVAGSWANDVGESITIEIVGDRVLAHFHTFTKNNRNWYRGVGDFTDEIYLTLYEVDRTRKGITTTEVGDGLIVFVNPVPGMSINKMDFSYSIGREGVTNRYDRLTWSVACGLD